ncbi:hypothetical protein E0L21_22070 [Kosakonia quasisacchari]|uniref:Uncharacterized protein n=1 Tax=Kosakonia quasisacchari TaxID=2529380 RepID=A0A4R0GMN4_9ENTR|nr:hypothetical protein [Kosakonia quasisacchari]TCB98676.1 hypothetical protein E0L21_22070 [Kosakonia quasisacchari]
MASEARNFINSIVKNFKESIGLINVLILEPDEPDALQLLYFKLDVIKGGIEQDVRMLSKARLDGNAMICLYQVYNAQNALNYCIGILRNTPLNNQFYYDFEDFKNVVNTLDAMSGRVFTTQGDNE